MDKVELHNQKISAITNRLPTWLVSLVLLFVGLGNFTDSIELMKNVYESISSKFSNQVEYDRTRHVRAGLNLAYVQDYIGEPQLLKELEGGLQVRYYIDEKYLISLYTQGERVSAYLIFAREDHFQPDMQGMNEQSLGDSSLFQLRQNTDRAAFEHSRNIAYFLESKEVNFGGGYLTNSYLGWVNYAAQFGPSPSPQLGALYDAEMLGENSAGKLTAAREHIRPNAFGYGELSIEQLQRGLLTSAELRFFD